MMLTKILIFAWTFGIINQRTTPFIIDCLTRVQKCPIGKEAWAIKNDRYRCKGSETYVCIQDSNRNLYEGCMSNFTIQANSGNCPVLIVCVKNKPYLGLKESYFPCPEEDPGCPAKNHPEYSIQELYKYPRCSGSQVFLNTSRTRQDSTTSGFNSTMDQVQGQGHTYIIVILIVIPVIILCSMIGCCLVYKRCKATTNENYAAVIFEEILDTDYKGLLRLLLSINESEADRIQILPFQRDDLMEIENIYTPILIIDDNRRRTSQRSDERMNSTITPDEMFRLNSGEFPRFIFMLGEAGYGKTVQCKRIAKSWCDARRHENEAVENQRPLSQLARCLTNFELLFFVQMHDFCNEHVDLIDMIMDTYSDHNRSKETLSFMKGVLEDGKYRSLILLDGLDEWNISDDQKKRLSNKCLPNCMNIYNCTILISMRSWKFIEVERIFRPNDDRVIRIKGLDKDGVKELAKSMLCNYFQVESDSDKFKTTYDAVSKAVSSPSSEIKSLLSIPLLAIFYILTMYEDVATGHSLTTFYLSMIEALIKRSTHDIGTEVDFSQSIVTNVLHEYPIVRKYKRQLSFLGRLALESLTSRNSDLVYSDERLNLRLGKETVDFVLRIGLVIKQQARGKFHENTVRIHFLHKTIQEFLASLYLFVKGAEPTKRTLLSEVLDIEKALELSSVLKFLSGLSPSIGYIISRHIQKLLLKDEDTKKYRKYFTGECFRKFFYLFDFQMKCYREARGTKSIKEFIDDMPECKFEVSDIVLLSHDTDVETIRESADILRHQANDVKSLYMLCIPDDNKEGIANEELNAFLEKSQSIESLNIDGYVDVKCRLFREISPRISCLRTLGLWNVAFSNDILNNLLTTNEAKMNIRALGLFNIASPSNLDAQFEYQFSSIHMPFNSWCAFLKEKVHSQRAAKCPSHSAASANPILKNILDTLPKFEHLSTLYVTYMEADPDRRALLRVFPDLKVLQTVGYIGSALRPRTDEDYDAEVINIILNAYYLKDIHLDEITLTKKGLKFKETSEVEGIWLQRFNMNESDWEVFVKSISGIKALRLRKVLLFNTNISKTNAKELKQSQQSVMIDRYEF